jgi:long-chain acyl-CoA synthetase
MKKIVIDRLKSLDFSEEFVCDALTGKHYSYNVFFARCTTLAEKLRKEAVGKEHLVLIMDNSIELLSCYFAAILSGKIATAIDPLKGKDEVAHILSSIDDGYIVVDKAGKAKVDTYDLLLEAGAFDATACAEGNVKSDVIDTFEQRDFLSDYLLTFTSGTTGNTKGVRHSLNNLFLTAEAFNNMFTVGKDNVFAHLMPMTYMAGILNSIFQPFVAGAKIVVLGRFSPMKAFTFWQDVTKNEINTFWMSPSMLTILLKVAKHEVGQEYCKEHKTLFFIGTAPLHQSTRDEFEAKYPVKLYASYGLSETLFLSTETPETLALGGGNVGKLLNGVEYHFGGDGEFLVDVPWMFLGYTNEPTEHYFDGTSYKTGDLAKIEDGILSIVGRSKDLIIKGGMNISPALIEGVVSGIQGVEECCVFSVLNKLKEELIVLAYTTTVEDKDSLEKTISSTVAKELGKNYLIDMFYRTKSIPKNINGKNDKKVLKENYQKEVESC